MDKVATQSVKEGNPVINFIRWISIPIVMYFVFIFCIAIISSSFFITAFNEYSQTSNDYELIFLNILNSTGFRVVAIYTSFFLPCLICLVGVLTAPSHRKTLFNIFFGITIISCASTFFGDVFMILMSYAPEYEMDLTNYVIAYECFVPVVCINIIFGMLAAKRILKKYNLYI
ncbi:MAG: hypothetical protein WCT46_03275 [Candidatus Gracilibacteria bacterium]|jgi:hypothetical protein